MVSLFLPKLDQKAKPYSKQIFNKTFLSFFSYQPRASISSFNPASTDQSSRPLSLTSPSPPTSPNHVTDTAISLLSQNTNNNHIEISMRARAAQQLLPLSRSRVSTRDVARACKTGSNVKTSKIYKFSRARKITKEISNKRAKTDANGGANRQKGATDGLTDRLTLLKEIQRRN